MLGKDRRKRNVLRRWRKTGRDRLRWLDVRRQWVPEELKCASTDGCEPEWWNKQLTWWWRAKSATTGQVGDTNKISQVWWRETMQLTTATFCRPVCGPLEALCLWRVRLSVRAQACVSRLCPASVNTAAIRTPTTARGVSVRTRDDNGSAGHGSRVKWVNKSEWITWVTVSTRDPSLTHDQVNLIPRTG